MPTALRYLVLSLLMLLTGCAHQPGVLTWPANDDVQATRPQAEEVLSQARDLIGIPYRYGGTSPERGFDCSGFIGYVYRNAADMTLPRSSRSLNALRAPSIKKSALAPGDLVFFAIKRNKRVNHVGIYVGDGLFVHAPSTGGAVRLDSLNKGYWHARYLSAKRVLK